MPKKAEIINLVSKFSKRVPLPTGYKWALERQSINGKSYYSLAIVREDYKHGDFLDCPRCGHLEANAFRWYLNGILEAEMVKERISGLVPLPEWSTDKEVC